LRTNVFIMHVNVFTRVGIFLLWLCILRHLINGTSSDRWNACFKVLEWDRRWNFHFLGLCLIRTCSVLALGTVILLNSQGHDFILVLIIHFCTLMSSWETSHIQINPALALHVGVRLCKTMPLKTIKKIKSALILGFKCNNCLYFCVFPNTWLHTYFIYFYIILVFTL
jgi:uncharacterized membrane protein